MGYLRGVACDEEEEEEGVRQYKNDPLEFDLNSQIPNLRYAFYFPRHLKRNVITNTELVIIGVVL